MRIVNFDSFSLRGYPDDEPVGSNEIRNTLQHITAVYTLSLFEILCYWQQKLLSTKTFCLEILYIVLTLLIMLVIHRDEAKAKSNKTKPRSCICLQRLRAGQHCVIQRARSPIGFYRALNNQVFSII